MNYLFYLFFVSLLFLHDLSVTSVPSVDDFNRHFVLDTIGITRLRVKIIGINVKTGHLPCGKMRFL